MQQTGISYGQLYRWKREKLIPEDWFIKQSSFTGQETFFPKEQILTRIKQIQSLKEQYTLEELAHLLSPELTERLFQRGELNQVEEIDPALIEAFGKDAFTYMEVILMVAIGKVAKGLDQQAVTDLTHSIAHAGPMLTNTQYVLGVYRGEKAVFGLVFPENINLGVDARLKPIGEVHLNNVASAFKLKYRKKINIHFEDAKED